MNFAKRMNLFGEGVFARLAAMKRNKISAGEKVFDLSIGAPNIPPPAHVMKVLSDEALKPENYVYAITDTHELLTAAANWYARRYGVELDPSTEICSLWGSDVKIVSALDENIFDGEPPVDWKNLFGGL